MYEIFQMYRVYDRELLKTFAFTVGPNKKPFTKNGSDELVFSDTK
jgi:hypothetical protein